MVGQLHWTEILIAGILALTTDERWTVTKQRRNREWMGSEQGMKGNREENEGELNERITRERANYVENERSVKKQWQRKRKCEE